MHLAGNAKIAGITEDLHISESDYNVALSIFFVGYVSVLPCWHVLVLIILSTMMKIIFEIPSNLMLKRVGPNAWIPLVMISFGIVLACMSAVSNGSGLLATRFFLGIAEAGLFPVSEGCDDFSYCWSGIDEMLITGSHLLYYSMVYSSRTSNTNCYFLWMGDCCWCKSKFFIQIWKRWLTGCLYNHAW